MQLPVLTVMGIQPAEEQNRSWPEGPDHNKQKGEGSWTADCNLM